MSLQAVKNHRRLYAFASIGIVIIALVLSHNAIKQQLNDWKLLPEPERLTELYFTHPNNVPTTYQVGVPQTVSFTVHNLEYRKTDYHYRIVEYSNDGLESKQLASGLFVLPQNAILQPNVSVLPVNLGSRVEIVVELTNVNESVDYWANAS